MQAEDNFPPVAVGTGEGSVFTFSSCFTFPTCFFCSYIFIDFVFSALSALQKIYLKIGMLLNSLDSQSKRISKNKWNGLKRICLILLFLRIDCSIGLLVTLLSSYLGVNNEQIFFFKKKTGNTPFYKSLGENIYLQLSYSKLARSSQFSKNMYKWEYCNQRAKHS